MENGWIDHFGTKVGFQVNYLTLKTYICIYTYMYMYVYVYVYVHIHIHIHTHTHIHMYLYTTCACVWVYIMLMFSNAVSQDVEKISNKVTGSDDCQQRSQGGKEKLGRKKFVMNK